MRAQEICRKKLAMFVLTRARQRQLELDRWTLAAAVRWLKASTGLTA